AHFLWRPARMLSASLGGLSMTCPTLPQARSLPNAVPFRTGQRHSRALHGCRPEGEIRPPRRAHGHGRYRRSPVERLPQAQPRGPEVARSRPFHTVQRTRLYAALLIAAFDWLRAGTGTAAGLSPAPRQDLRPPRI